MTKEFKHNTTWEMARHAWLEAQKLYLHSDDVAPKVKEMIINSCNVAASIKDFHESANGNDLIAQALLEYFDPEFEEVQTH